MAGKKGRSGGHNRKPNEIKILEGNPGKRSLTIPPPFTRTKNVPPAPSHLSPIARAEWARLADELFNLNLLKKVDVKSFEQYCVLYAKYRDANAKVKEQGMVIKSPNGYPMVNPYHTIAMQCGRDMMRILTEFGMTPASRTRLHAEKQPGAKDNQGDGWDSLLSS